MRLSCGLLSLVLLGSSTSVFAEGSAELDGTENPATFEDHDQLLASTTDIFIDLLANEKICWRGTGSVNIVQPNLTTPVAAAMASGNCVDGAVGVTGAYRLRTISAQQANGVEWDIRVCASSVANADCLTDPPLPAPSNERLGRVWSTSWNFLTNNPMTTAERFAERFSSNGSVYALVPGGDTDRDAVIEMQMRGVSGATYRIAANTVGPVTSPGGVRTNRSAPTANHAFNGNLPLYLSVPARALLNWTTPSVTNVVLAPSCGPAVVQDVAPGQIQFGSNVTGQYVLICDADKNGIYDYAGTTDFSSGGTATMGTNMVSWNGRNNAGANVTPDTYDCVVRLNVGEFHYAAEDIETAYPGIRMFRVESDRTTRTAIAMFWDDVNIAADADTMPNMQASPRAPLASGLNVGAYADAPSAFHYVGGNLNMPLGNARAWGNFDDDGKGNNAFLDQFTAAATSMSEPFQVRVLASGSDTDSDGLTNQRECALGSDPTNEDSDEDGVTDGMEATMTMAPNTDGQGPADILDPDSDNDGVIDGMDADRFVPTVCRDTDGDQCDDCTNTGNNQSGGNTMNDGVDTDADAACNTGDPDDDNDGVPDAMDTMPINANQCRDTDSDGCNDCAVTGANSSGGDPDDDGLDTDGDGACDAGDPDDDGDGVADGSDSAPLDPNECRDQDGDGCTDCAVTGANNSGGEPLNDGPDTDADGICNASDPDDDNDGVIDAMDAEPTDPVVCRDMDGDGCTDCAVTGANNSGGNVLNDGTDTDGDGLCDDGTAGDANDGDPDDDNDGVDDAMDAEPTDPNLCRDSDSDGCDDCSRTGDDASGGDADDDGPDPDGDGICNLEDTDGDGVRDADDLDRDNDGIPNTSEGSGDLDGDGIENTLDLDSDGDGLFDIDEGGGGDLDEDGDGRIDDLVDTSPNDGLHDPLQQGGAALPLPDTDEDGDPDFLDADADGEDTDGDGVPNDEDADRDNDGIPNASEGDDDLDGDGIPNDLDLDSDGDGTSDIDEAGGGELDPDGDGRIDALTDTSPKNGLHDALQGDGKLPLPDSDGDGAPDFLDANDDDADDDGVANANDLDRDNDGIPNSSEGEGDLDRDGIDNEYDLDSDGDGLSDIEEAGGGELDRNDDGQIDELIDTSPRDGYHDPLQEEGRALPLPDSDGDGAEDFLDPDEDADGDGVSNARDLDRDNDGILDSSEGEGDYDGDGIPNQLDLDSDDDGVFDIVEAGGGELDRDGDGRIDDFTDTSPRDGYHDGLAMDGEALPLPDTDEDGRPDFLDADDDGDGLPTTDERGDGEEPQDTDDDGEPDYLDADDDDDGILTADELTTDGKTRDTDRDGIPNNLDDDDDGDGVKTRNELDEDGEPTDTDDDGKPDHLDTDDDGDGIPTDDEPRDADGNGIPDRLERVRGGLAGGALCAASVPGSRGASDNLPFWLGFSIAFAVSAGAWRRRVRIRRKALSKPRKPAPRTWPLVLLGVGCVLAPHAGASAQAALDQFHPAPLATDGFAIGRPTVLPHGTVGAVLLIDYANDPLVYERIMRNRDTEEHVVEDDLVLHGVLSVGLWDRVALFVGAPVHLVMEGDDELSAPAAPADGAGLGDIWLGGRIRIAGDDASVAALGLELIARLPTAEWADDDQNYRGDAIGSYEPALLLELHAGVFDVRARAGVRFREEAEVSNLELGHEVLYGLGARLRVADPFWLHAEFQGSTFLSDVLGRETSPAEALGGAKLNVDGWVIGAAAGPGLLRGYGSPDLRIVGMLGYADPGKEAPPPAVDSDRDGLLDPQDRCPRAPEDRDGFEDQDGCPDPDNDRDGVLDVSDKCRNQPEDADQFEDEEGCPDPDNDQDGILDVDDRCPLEKEDADSFEDSDGCPDPDNDKDRILDADDACANEPEDFDGWEDTDGCPEEAAGLVKLTCEKIEIKDSVYFDTGSDRIQERSFTLLNAVADVLGMAEQIRKLRVEGHTDDKGKAAKNLALSERRAAAVLGYLVRRGILSDRLISEGFGETRPIADNKTAAGRSQNRRVEFVVAEGDACP